MKHTAGIVILFFLCFFAYTKVAGPIPFSVSSIITEKTDTFSVSGEGEITMIPDIAVVSAGVRAQSDTVTSAQEELNSTMNAIANAVKQLGINEKDIKTTRYSISPIYDYDTPERSITGYEADATLSIKVRKLNNANQVIDAATANGANQVGGITFDVDDKTKAENQARELAVKDAKSKAEQAARTAGFTLGKIIHYSEDGGASPRPVMMGKLSLDSVQEAPPTQVEPGSTELTVQVTLSYEIR